MNTFEKVMLILVAAVTLPFLLYMSAKLISFGVSMGRHKFHQYLKREESENGKK